MSDINKKRRQIRLKRKASIRKKLSGSAERPRVAVNRSHKYTYAQVVDDDTGSTLLSCDSRSAAAVEARAANQNGDNYVLTAVLFAAVLFFSGVASRLENRWNRRFVNLIGIIAVAVGVVILIQLPKLF